MIYIAEDLEAELRYLDCVRQYYSIKNGFVKKKKEEAGKSGLGGITGSAADHPSEMQQGPPESSEILVFLVLSGDQMITSVLRTSAISVPYSSALM